MSLPPSLLIHIHKVMGSFCQPIAEQPFVLQAAGLTQDEKNNRKVIGKLNRNQL